MVAPDPSQARVRTYGNFRRPVSAGVGSLGTVGTVVLFVGAVVFTMLMVFRLLVVSGLWAALVLLILGTLMVKDGHERSGLERLTTRMAWRRTKKQGRNLYRSGPIGRAGGTCRLPGLLARAELTEWEDSYGRPFGLVDHDAVGHVSVTIRCEADGNQLVDAEQVDRWVGQWGQWLAMLGQEVGVVAAAVTVETAPDTGARLRREVESSIDPDAPELAQRALRMIVADYPAGSAEVKTWVSLTFSRSSSSTGRRRPLDEVAREIGTRLPQLTLGLSETGAGAATPLTAQELCETVRIAYDPAVAPVIDEVVAEGKTPDLSWDDIGPAAAEATWDTFFHDSAVSRTWMMSVAPRGEVFSSVLTRLLSPHGDIDRKRVTICYRPIDVGRAAEIVERDKRAADFRVNNAQRPSARALTAARSAYDTATEEARGAGLVDFGMLITATVTDEDRLGDARSAIENLAGSARLRIRPVYGSQDSAFAACLPLGMVLPAHSRVPAAIRKAM